MPTYRRAQLLERAVESVLAQTFTDFELLIVDDNVDGHPQQLATSKVLQARFSDQRLRYIINQGEHGGSGARNAGIAEARGGYVAFLDDDEDWLPEKLAKQVTLLDQAPAEVGVVDCGFFDYKADGSVRQARPKMQGWILERLLSKTGGRAPKLSTMLCRREVFARVGVFDTTLPAREDYDLYLRISRHYQFVSLPEPLSNKRSDAGQRLTGNPENFVKGFEGVYQKILPELQRRPAIHAIYLLKHAEVLAKAGDKPQAWKKYHEAKRLRLFNPRLVTYGVKLLRS
ncbi:MAG: glycosyltransferase family 2 protein [Halomonadaceae bacterium]|nr:MAG: glycosyltransferase family 2 protein [Halomonadaceae bacterium]